MKNELENISNWMRINKLSLNASKIQFMVVGHRRKLNRVGNELPNPVLNNGVMKRVKVKGVPYTFVRRGVPVREDTNPEPLACEVGWPVPFIATFISPVLPPGTHLLLGE